MTAIQQEADEQLSLDLPIGIDEPWRLCLRCASLGYSGHYPLVFFRRTGLRGHVRVCLGCDNEVNVDRLLRESLGRRIRRHAKDFGLSAKAYRDRYGLHTDVVMSWFKRKWDSGVLDCGCQTHAMNHGWRDAEIDQRDPRDEPFFPANWQLMCSVHNNSKGRSKPADFAARQRGWELFKESRGVTE